MAGEPTPAAMDFVAPDTWNLSGHWTALGLGALARRLAEEPAPPPAAGARAGRPVVDGGRVEALDSVGAMLIERWLAGVAPPGDAGAGVADGGPATVRGVPPRAAPDTSRAAPPPGPDARVEWRNWRPAHRALLERIALQSPRKPPAPAPAPRAVARLGRLAWDTWEDGRAMLALVGECALTLGRTIRHPARLRWRQTLHHIDVAGLSAMPIVGLLSLLMGIVVAYQGAEQLRRYGANIYVVDLVAVSMLREFAPLVTAIIIAGRSGAAFAAQLGTMAVTEEIDALRVLGIAPAELLVLPRVFALVVALPLLTMFSDVMGVIGGMAMARAKLGVTYLAFIDRLPHAVEMSTLWVGLFKAPVFAAIVALVGCFQGLRTAGGADNVGRQTTRAVVQSIFLIIVVDALFSVIFSILDL
jgi:phospholipid/cholesterol/gamma-HCH transport system permease protein